MIGTRRMVLVFMVCLTRRMILELVKFEIGMISQHWAKDGFDDFMMLMILMKTPPAYVNDILKMKTPPA